MTHGLLFSDKDGHAVALLNCGPVAVVREAGVVAGQTRTELHVRGAGLHEVDAGWVQVLEGVGVRVEDLHRVPEDGPAEHLEPVEDERMAQLLRLAALEVQLGMPPRDHRYRAPEMCNDIEQALRRRLAVTRG